MLSALSTGHKTGIVVVAGIFILFALSCSFLFTRSNPNFPGKRVGLFLAVCVLLTAAMLGAIIALAGEPKETRKGEESSAGSPPATSTQTAPPAAGDAAAGKALFASNGCSSCHTYTPAGSTGAVGPNLNNLASDAKTANRGSVQQYASESIMNPSAYVVPKYPNGVMPKFNLTPKQLADLVAFVTKG